MEQDSSAINRQITEALDRIDQVLEGNKKLVWIVVIMALAIFALGLLLLIIGFNAGDWRILTPSAVVTALLYWPINKILKIRKENIELAVVPALVRTLPPEEAAEEIIKLIDKIRP